MLSSSSGCYWTAYTQPSQRIASLSPSLRSPCLFPRSLQPAALLPHINQHLLDATPPCTHTSALTSPRKGGSARMSSPLLPYSTGSTPALDSSSSLQAGSSTKSRRRSSFSSPTRGRKLASAGAGGGGGAKLRVPLPRSRSWLWVLLGLISVALNLKSWLAPAVRLRLPLLGAARAELTPGPIASQLPPPGVLTRPQSILSTLPPVIPHLSHLIMVPGHAIWGGCDATKAANDGDWILEDMQKGGDVRAYIKHITKG